MNMKDTLFRLAPIALAACLAAQPAAAGPFVNNNGKAATPTTYNVTVNSIAFKQPDGSYYTYFSGTGTIDIGNVGVGGSGGAVGSGQALPPGSYSAIRIVMSRNFGFDASATGVGGPGGLAAANKNCATSTALSGTASVPTGFVDLNVTEAANAAGSTLQTVKIPTGGAGILAGGQTVQQKISATSGLTDDGTNLTIEIPLTITMPEGSEAPAMSINYDVTNTVEFIWDGVKCFVMPLPPKFTVSVPSYGYSQSFDPAI